MSGPSDASARRLSVISGHLQPKEDAPHPSLAECSGAAEVIPAALGGSGGHVSSHSEDTARVKR